MNVRACQHVKVCVVRDEGKLHRCMSKPLSLRAIKLSSATRHLPCHKSRQGDRTFHLRVSALSHPDCSIASICAFTSSTSESQTLVAPTFAAVHGTIKEQRQSHPVEQSSTSVEAPNSNAEKCSQNSVPLALVSSSKLVKATSNSVG